MKWIMLSVGVVLLAVAGYSLPGMMRPNDVYALPIDEAHRLLAEMRIPADADGPLGAHPVVKVEDSATAISWAGGPRGAIGCTARLTPTDVATTRVDVRCETDRPDSRTMLALARIGMTEQIDSTLRGRPYNKQAVTIGASAVTAITTVAPDRPADAPTASPFAPTGEAPPPPSTLPGDQPAEAPPPVNAPVIDASPVG